MIDPRLQRNAQAQQTGPPSVNSMIPESAAAGQVRCRREVRRRP